MDISIYMKDSITIYNKINAIILYCINFIRKYYFTAENRCVCCGKKLKNGSLCKKCQNKILAFPGIEEKEHCDICGKELISSTNICFACRHNPILKNTTQVFSIYSYRLWMKNMIYQWKMGGDRTFSFIFAKMMYDKLQEISRIYPFPFKIPVVPVPPRPGKIKEKGWDQILEICDILQKLWNVPVLRILKRININQQKNLGKEDRLKIIGTAYSVKSSSDIQKIVVKQCQKFPESVIIVDDILTTGATLESCAEILKGIGIKNVFALTLFIVD